MKRVSGHIEHLNSNEIFVFGSNLKGKHETGAAKKALEFGAVYGEGRGLFGSTYALPTVKDKIDGIRILMELQEVEVYVSEFIRFAESRPDLTFLVTEIGCGLAGFEVSEVAPFFMKAKTTDNICLPESFWKVIG